MQENLKAKTVSGMIWSALQRFGTMGISFVSNIVLARLLTPDDYGCIGMLAIFITVSNTFVDGGFGSALIQKKDVTQKDYSTIFWWNLFLSVVLYGVLFISAPAVSRFYNIPLLESVLQVQGVVLIINALNIVQTNQLRKSINFKRLATIHIVSHIVAAVLAIVLAYMGWGVWALVTQQIVASSITSVMLWVMNRWMPSLCFSVESFKQLFNFGGFILASDLINTFCNNVQGLLIGKFFNPATLGYYTQAFKLENVASLSISSVVNQVSYPVLSKLQSDNIAMKNTIHRLVSSIAYITFPLMLLLVLIAEPLILLLYGEKWIPSIPYFQIICIGGIAVCLQGVTYQAVASIGKSRELFWWTIIKRGLGLILVIGGMLLFDMDGLLWGFVISCWVLTVINSFLVDRFIGYSLYRQFKDLLPIIMVSIVTFIATYLVINIFNFNIYIEIIFSFFLYLLIYLSLSSIFKIKSFLFVIEIIKDKLKSKQ
jgi:O-antigen/teichoic acid export membrane protein